MLDKSETKVHEKCKGHYASVHYERCAISVFRRAKLKFSSREEKRRRCLVVLNFLLFRCPFCKKCSQLQ